MTELFRARYRIGSYLPLEKAAAVLAGEQSSGTFTQVPGETAELKEKHAARVAGVTPIDDLTERLPGAWNPDGAPKPRFGVVDIDFPVDNVGASLTSLLNTVAGNLFELREFAALKLIDLDVPQPVLENYPGPTAGIDGTRQRIAPEHKGAVVGTIVKPSVGLPLPELAALVRELAGAGLDFIKDDELNANPPYAPLAERVRTVMPEIERAADVTGKKTMYAFNISDDIDVMLRNVELVEVGSIAPAVRIGRDMFGARPVPILPAQPDLGRYTVFGNHFGRDVTGVHRLDRLPSMAHHPVTPMTEADLRRHFAAQLATEVGGLPITALRIGDGARVLQELSEEGRVAFVMDALDNDDLHAAAQLLLAELDGVLFAVGSGGLSVGLAAVRTASRPVADTAAGPKPGTCLVVSGSAAGRTSDQIDAAVAAGWTALPLDPARLSTDAEAREAVAELGKTASDAFGKSPGVIVYTAHRDSLPPTSTVPSNAVGAALGDVILAVRRRTNVSRVLLAGGDTSGYVLTRLRATTLSATGAVGSDLVLGTVTSLDEDINGLEVVLKGGQLGHLDVFESALETRAASST